MRWASITPRCLNIYCPASPGGTVRGKSCRLPGCSAQPELSLCNVRRNSGKKKIMAPPRMNEEFKRGEGVADASLGHSKEWTGSSGCKATPRGDLEWAAGVAQGEAKEHRQDTKFSVFSFCDDRDSVGGLSLEFCCAQRDKKKKKKKKVLSQRQRVRPPPNNILRVLSSRTDSLGVGALFGSHGSQTQ